ncbi:unnamed protein product, partial [Effrenium voratum]
MRGFQQFPGDFLDADGMQQAQLPLNMQPGQLGLGQPFMQTGPGSMGSMPSGSLGPMQLTQAQPQLLGQFNQMPMRPDDRRMGMGMPMWSQDSRGMSMPSPDMQMPSMMGQVGMGQMGQVGQVGQGGQLGQVGQVGQVMDQNQILGQPAVMGAFCQQLLGNNFREKEELRQPWLQDFAAMRDLDSSAIPREQLGGLQQQLLLQLASQPDQRLPQGMPGLQQDFQDLHMDLKGRRMSPFGDGNPTDVGGMFP